MNESYKMFHPRWYRRRVPIFWWIRQFSYTRFISRELTSLAVGYGAVLLLVQIWAAGSGEAAYTTFRSLVTSTPMTVVNVLVLAALLFHTLTWLHLAPKAMVLYVGNTKVPAALVLFGHYLAWLAASILVISLLLGGGG